MIRTGADFIKIMGGGGVSTPTDKLEHLQFTPEEMRAITTVADNAGMWVCICRIMAFGTP